MLHEIKFTNWPAFCQRLNEQRAGATVKLETINLNGIRTELVASAEFQSIVFSNADACSDLIVVRLRNHEQTVHEILDPIRITLHPTDSSGNFNPLQIAAENGITILTLHPAIHAQMLV
ncbi:MAG TPA: hypothetical protein VKJ65_01190 [Phycisphaerae bacterium]|nr:hypothetical protein [Phycisphaerae bacterium]